MSVTVSAIFGWVTIVYFDVAAVGEPLFLVIPLWQLGDGQTDRCYIAVGTTKEGYLDIPFSSSFWEWHNWIRSMEQGSSAFDPGERDERCNV